MQDPTTEYLRPQFDEQKQQRGPGLAWEMEPKPDHGEKTYRGTGRLAGRKAIVTGGRSSSAGPRTNCSPHCARCDRGEANVPYLVTNDGVRLHHEEKGAGPPLVLIHGWTFSGRFFVRNVDALAEDFRVVTLDLRGYGVSEKPDHGYRVARLAKDLADLLDALDLRDA